MAGLYAENEVFLIAKIQINFKLKLFSIKNDKA